MNKDFEMVLAEKQAPKTRFTILARNMALLAPFLATGAFAQSTNPAGELATAASTGMGGLVAAVVAILLVGIGIKVLWFGNRQVKTGINQAK